MLNLIWLALVLTAVLVGGFTGRLEAMTEGAFTTAKDAVRLEAQLGRTPGIPWLYLPLEVSIEPSQAFAAWLTERLSAARGEA